MQKFLMRPVVPSCGPSAVGNGTHSSANPAFIEPPISPELLQLVNPINSTGGEKNSSSRVHRFVPTGAQFEDELFTSSSVLRPEHSVRSSAFTAHTAHASGGMALPAGHASRAAGATLDAARPARAWSFVSYDVATARVEPNLVAATQHRRCETKLQYDLFLHQEPEFDTRRDYFV